MDKKENGFSLVIVVIFMSIAALFIGYVMGGWLISFLVEEDTAEIAEEVQNSPNVNQQISEQPEQNSEAEAVNNSENNLTAPTAEEENIAPEQNEENSTELTANPNQDQSDQLPEADGNNGAAAEITGGFGVQIGAFSNYNNALSVRDKAAELGFEVVVTDSSPHQVQVVGYQSRDQAESAAQELEEAGYPGFIVIRE